MTDSTPEIEGQVRLAFARAEPTREFRSCKTANEGGQMFVRIYSQRSDSKKLMPIPYQVFRFDMATGLLTSPSKEEATLYSIPNYK